MCRFISITIFFRKITLLRAVDQRLTDTSQRSATIDDGKLLMDLFLVNGFVLFHICRTAASIDDAIENAVSSVASRFCLAWRCRCFAPIVPCFRSALY